MCPPIRPFTNLHATDPAPYDAAFPPFSRSVRELRADLYAARRADARTPVPHHAAVVVRSVVGRGRVYAIALGQGRTSILRRLGVDPFEPVGQRLAGHVARNGVGMTELLRG